MALTSLAMNYFCFPTKFGMKFTTSFPSSWFDWQLHNEIAKFVANFWNFKQTSETVCQKFCKTRCKIISAEHSSNKGKSKVTKKRHSMVIFWIKVRRWYWDPARENWARIYLYFNQNRHVTLVENTIRH